MLSGDDLKNVQSFGARPMAQLPSLDHGVHTCLCNPQLDMSWRLFLRLKQLNALPAAGSMSAHIDLDLQFSSTEEVCLSRCRKPWHSNPHLLYDLSTGKMDPYIVVMVGNKGPWTSQVATGTRIIMHAEQTNSQI